MTDGIAGGRLAQSGLLDQGAVAGAEALLAALRDSDVETVRVLFTDPHGVLRGKTIVAAALPSVFHDGMAVPSTLMLKDTSHRTAFPVWDAGGSPMQGAGDILLVPDPATYRALPWAPHAAWILCDTVTRDGAPIDFAPRRVLRDAMDRMAQAGLQLRVGLEVEFHVYAIEDDHLGHADATMPAAPPETRNLTPGYQFLTETVYAQVDPLLNDLRQMCQQMGLPVRSMEVEMGPSQFEFTFDPADPMTHADNMVMFRTAVKEVCAAKGLHATFMCRPGVANAAASGWHIHQSVLDASGRSLMIPTDDALTPTASGWIAGLLAHAEESCLLTTPTVNGYKRYQPYQLAPERIAWGRDNRGAMLRGLMAPGQAASRIENRAPETAANPYYCFASQILSGLSGLQSGMTAPEPVETPYDTNVALLPKSLGAAIEKFAASSLYAQAWGAEAVEVLTQLKTQEWDRYLAHVSDWEQAEYFRLY